MNLVSSASFAFVVVSVALLSKTKYKTDHIDRLNLFLKAVTDIKIVPTEVTWSIDLDKIIDQ